MKVSIIGTGYVGIVTGACLAEKGHQILCVDKDPAKVSKINQGISPIFEVGLEDILKKDIGKTLTATTDLRQAVLGSGITLIAVGTPFDGARIDLTQVKEVSAQIGAVLKEKAGYHAVVVKSTVVPGTTDEVVLPILESESGKKAGSGFGVGMNPEFLTEGQAVADFMYPDRIVLGANDEKCMSLLEELYKGFEGTPILKTNSKTAEMIKYASNAMLATQISFANEIGNLCSALGGVDIVDVMKGVHLSNYLRPAAKDGSRIQAPISSFLEAGDDAAKVDAARGSHGEAGQRDRPTVERMRGVGGRTHDGVGQRDLGCGARRQRRKRPRLRRADGRWRVGAAGIERRRDDERHHGDRDEQQPRHPVAVRVVVPGSGREPQFADDAGQSEHDQNHGGDRPATAAGRFDVVQVGALDEHHRGAQPDQQQDEVLRLPGSAPAPGGQPDERRDRPSPPRRWQARTAPRTGARTFRPAWRRASRRSRGRRPGTPAAASAAASSGWPRRTRRPRSTAPARRRAPPWSAPRRAGGRQGVRIPTAAPELAVRPRRAAPSTR